MVFQTFQGTSMGFQYISRHKPGFPVHFKALVSKYGLPVYYKVSTLIGVLFYIHTLCMQATIALATLCMCADLLEPKLLDDARRTKIFCSGLGI